MDTEDFIGLFESSGSGGINENFEMHKSDSQPTEVESQHSYSVIKGDIFNGENMVQDKSEVNEDGRHMQGNYLEMHKSDSQPTEVESQHSYSVIKGEIFNGENMVQDKSEVNEDGRHMQGNYLEMDLVGKESISGENIKLSEATDMEEKMNSIDSAVPSENGFLTAQNDSTIDNHNRDGTSIGVKRARVTYDEERPLVHVIYNSLTRDSKKKLGELLQQWSEWHARQNSSPKDTNEVLESGEETYFPALNIGLEKSTVSFWMDNQSRKQQIEYIQFDGDSVPMYDRGYALGLTLVDDSTNLESLEKADASRCFNCGSYSHSLKECPKPRDNVAVNNARKQHQSKRNQTASSRNPTRYYQNSPGGKYDGLRPGVLGAETREVLGLRDLDPPPWLSRMREMGYPPGYLDPEDEDQPSGITIYADEETWEEQEDGEILETNDPEQQKRMSVEFPGINAPIPENADERRWTASQGSSSSDGSRSRLHHRLSHSSDSSKDNSLDRRGSWDYKDSGASPAMCDYKPRFSGFDSNHKSDSCSPRSNIPRPRSPILGRSFSDKGRSPLVHEGSPSHSPYSQLPYSSPNTQQSPQHYGAGYERWAYESPYFSTSDTSSRSKDRNNQPHRHHRR